MESDCWYSAEWLYSARSEDADVERGRSGRRDEAALRSTGGPEPVGDQALGDSDIRESSRSSCHAFWRQVWRDKEVVAARSPSLGSHSRMDFSETCPRRHVARKKSRAFETPFRR